MNKDSGWGEMVRDLRFLHLGVVMAVSVVTFALVGQWVDRRLGTAPAFLVVGVLIGIFAGGYWSYRMLERELNRDAFDEGQDDRERKEDRHDEPPSE